jgi:hypothetical protein
MAAPPARREELDEAIASFAQALESNPGELRARLGLVLVLRRRRREADAEGELALVRAGIGALQARGRGADAAMLTAAVQVIAGELDAAVRTLDEMLAATPAGPTGWSIPLEPLATRLVGHPGFGEVLAGLAGRAR